MVPVRLVAAIALLAVTTTACTGGLSTLPGEDVPAAAEPTAPPGGPLPDAELARLGEPGSLRTSSLRGRPSVINFWSTWCPFCVEEMPEFERVHQQVGRDAHFVGINLEDEDDLALKLANGTGVTYELVKDPDGAYFDAVGGRGMPTTLFVDADGSVVHHQVGPMTAGQLRALVEDLLLGG